MTENLARLFKTDLNTIPDSTFTKVGSEANSIKQEYTQYYKLLDFLEFDIFDSIEIIHFDTGSKNVFFIGHDLANTEFTHIANLFKEIYFIYGEDRNSKGFLEEEEVDYFFSDELYTLFRRSWSDMTKHENPIELYIDRSENTINLSIFAVK